MSKARLVITAVVVEGRSPSEVARTYGVARSWVYKLVDRYRSEGDAAFEPRSRRPKPSPTATDPTTVALIKSIREQLAAEGLHAGADTIRWDLELGHYVSRVRGEGPTGVGTVVTRLGAVPSIGTVGDSFAAARTEGAVVCLFAARAVPPRAQQQLGDDLRRLGTVAAAESANSAPRS